MGFCASAERAEGVEVAEGADGDEGAEVGEGAGRTDVAAIYIVIWLEHHGNRLYGVNGASEQKV